MVVTFLAQAYDLKVVADYAVGLDAHVTRTEAEQAIEIAGRFIVCISGIVSPQHPAPGTDDGPMT